MFATIRRALLGFAGACILSGFAPFASASVHLWSISEVYSSSDGSVQYVELFTASSSQQYFKSFGNNSQLNSNAPNTFSFPSDAPGDSAGHHVLVGTSNLSAVAGVTPDFTLAAGSFLLVGGGTVTLTSPQWGTISSVAYPALPGGNTSYNVSGAQLAVGTPTNYAGTVGTLPSPGTTGDLDDDGDVDSNDIDILWNVIRPEVAGSDDPGTNDNEDFNNDGFVNEKDVDYMLKNLLTAGANRAYGDADLDGGVGGLDYTAWRVRTGTGWANGDFDGDGGVGGLDYTLWRTRPTAYPSTVGPHGSGGPSVVPEPSALLLAAFGLAALLAAKGRSKF